MNDWKAICIGTLLAASSIYVVVLSTQRALTWLDPAPWAELDR